MSRDRLGEFYGLNIWPMDPDTEAGRARFKEAMEKFMELMRHEFFKGILSKNDEIKILEVCGGSGIGGCALARVLEKNEINVSLCVTDIREEDLEKAIKWIEGSKGIELETKAIDAVDIDKLEERPDIILMYGLSTPHFNPWEMVRFLAASGVILSEKGILIIEEADRRFFIFYLVKYKDLITGKTLDNKIYMDIHTGYDPIRGVFKRTYSVIPGPPKLIDMESYLWGVAEIATFTWLFFEDVDIVKQGNRNYFVLGIRPRKKLIPSDLKMTPKALMRDK